MNEAEKCPPPKRFKAAVGVRSAKLLKTQPPFIKRHKSRGRFAVGIRYEKVVMAMLARVAFAAGESLHQGQWVEFWDKSGKRWCQMDAVLFDHKAKRAIIYEVKYQHTSDAWWQLRWLYLPVLEVLYPGYVFGLCEIVHWYDPLVAFPETPALTTDPRRIQNVGTVAVHIYNPRRDPWLLAHGPGGGESVHSQSSKGGCPEGADGLPDIV